MRLRRRRFMGLTAGAALGSGCATAGGPAAGTTSVEATPGDKWDAVRAEFDQDPAYSNMTGFLLAPHPRRVREAIARYRDALDRNPPLVIEAQLAKAMAGEENNNSAPRTAAAKFLAVPPDEIALTDSTTMGLGLVYGAIAVPAGREIVTSSHGHYSTQQALAYRAERDGIAVRTVDLYADPAKVTVNEVVGRLRKAIRKETVVVGVTWVHSSTGVKMPIRAMADAIAKINAKRDEADRVLLVVDGVHGFGIDAVTMPDLGCDVFIAGCHKWLFGPRGTGIVWARPEAWARISPTIAPFEGPPFLGWMEGKTVMGPGGIVHTPGGFHSFEHRWALPEAFAFHEEIGRPDIEARIVELNAQLKEGLAGIEKVHLHTPVDPKLSAGINCFQIDGVDKDEVVARLLEDRIIASTSPYRVSYPRLAPSLLNDPRQVDEAIAAVAAIAKA